MSSNENLFVLWLKRRQQILSLEGDNEEAEWLKLLEAQKSFISKKLVDYMPDTVYEVKAYMKLYFHPQKTIMDYLDFLVKAIDDFSSGEFRLLSLLSEILRVEGNNLQMGYYLLQRQDMLNYLKGIDDHNFHNKKMVTFVLADMVDKIINGGDCGESGGWVHNSLVPRLFMTWSEILKDKFPTVFMLIADALPKMMKLWKWEYNRCGGMDNADDCTKCWGYYTIEYREKLKAAYE